jgi:hypothetical protein
MQYNCKRITSLYVGNRRLLGVLFAVRQRDDGAREISVRTLPSDRLFDVSFSARQTPAGDYRLVGVNHCEINCEEAVDQVFLEAARVADVVANHPDTLYILQPTKRRPGRPPVPPSERRELATRYVELVSAGDRSPVKTIAREQFRSPAAVRSRLTQCRKHGDLPPATPGKAG